MLPGDGVVSVGAGGGVHDRARAAGMFLGGGVAEGLAVAVLGVPYPLGDPVFETDHVVLEVADVVSLNSC